MPRARPVHVCSDCGHEETKWYGRCPDCGAWGTLAAREPPAEIPDRRRGRTPAEPRALASVDAEHGARRPTGLGELDRVLGGGLVPGMVALLGGAPGIGKSTLLLQAAQGVAATGGDVLYVSAEESLPQLRLRADRLGAHDPRLLALAEPDVEAVLRRVRASPPALLLVDSIQAMHSPELRSVPGSVAQVRECAQRFVELAKALSVPTILVGHVTKDGAIAGPRTLEHVVDTVLHFEGERHHRHRILRTWKNRFGAADLLGVFRMREEGLSEVPNPSEAFLSEKPRETPGSVVLAALEGSRPILVELQALVGSPSPGTPRRTALGFDGNRLALILAILQRALGLDLADRDVFVNVTGGLSIQEPAADLAAAVAIASAASRRPVPDDWVVAGELGLTGEVRSVARLDARLDEAARLGFRAAVVPPVKDADVRSNLTIEAVDRVEEAAARALGTAVQIE